MTLFLGAFLLLPLLGLGFLFSSITLYFTLKFFAVPDNSFLRAFTVTILALIGSLVAGVVFNLIGFLLAGVTNVLSVFAPFAIYLLLLQKYYGLNLLQGAIASVIQGLITLMLGTGLVIGVLLPMGLASLRS